MFDSPGPRWFSIAAHRPFVDDLAVGLTRLLPAPEALADAVLAASIFHFGQVSIAQAKAALAAAGLPVRRT